jgi:hypothetical protein
MSTSVPIEFSRMKSPAHSWRSPLSDRRLQRHHDPGNIVSLDNLVHSELASVIKPPNDAPEAVDETGNSGVRLGNS